MYALNAWDESPYHTDEERAILALTEQVTLISQKHISDEIYNRVIAQFGKQKTASLIMAIISINAWKYRYLDPYDARLTAALSAGRLGL